MSDSTQEDHVIWLSSRQAFSDIFDFLVKQGKSENSSSVFFVAPFQTVSVWGWKT